MTVVLHEVSLARLQEKGDRKVMSAGTSGMCQRLLTKQGHANTLRTLPDYAAFLASPVFTWEEALVAALGEKAGVLQLSEEKHSTALTDHGAAGSWLGLCSPPILLYSVQPSPLRLPASVHVHQPGRNENILIFYLFIPYFYVVE